MALIKCPECVNAISDKSTICIHCGYPIKAELQKQQYLCDLEKETEEKKKTQEEKKERKITNILSNMNHMDSVQLYKSAHSLHYTVKDLETAYCLYDFLIQKYSESKESEYAKSQIENLLNGNESLSALNDDDKMEKIVRYLEKVTDIKVNAQLNGDKVTASELLDMRKKIIELVKRGRQGYFEYEVHSMLDKHGRTNVEHVEKLLKEKGLEGWRLKGIVNNELGKNALAVGGFGINSTVEETVLILERYIEF